MERSVGEDFILALVMTGIDVELVRLELLRTEWRLDARGAE